jgi:glycosyltransferase involved in cell wall biosynthesis
LPNQEFEDFSIISKEYGIEAGSYLYTVSALAKHKNVITLLRLIKLIRDRGDKTIPHKLIVSGIGVKKKDADNIDSSTIFSYVSANNLEDFVIFTGFVSDKRRNSLIINSRFFLYPSLFEGFGMPPLEAMKLGANVITTRCTSLPEVTHDLCFYVDNPVDEKEWYNCIRDNINRESRVIEFEENNPQIVAKKYLEIINQAK